mgnify:CR=1 FL=1
MIMVTDHVEPPSLLSADSLVPRGGLSTHVIMHARVMEGSTTTKGGSVDMVS